MSEQGFIRSFIAALACGLGGCGVALLGYFIAPHLFFPAWLAAFWYCLSLPLGALALLLVHDLTGGRWEIIARAPLEAAVATMPLFILAFLPLIAGMTVLYPWTHADVLSSLPNRWYLNVDFFGVRAAIYLLVWNFLPFIQTRPQRPAWLSGVGLILLGFSNTYAAIDWIMSIEPHWFSTIYGMMVGAGQFVVALSFILLVSISRQPTSAIDPPQFRHHLATLATLLLAVDIFWAYTAYSQYLIIWEENLHAEIPWYLERLRDFWRPLIYVIAIGHLVVPLFVLVWTPTKKTPWVVATVCAILVLADLLHVWWLVLPRFRGAGLGWIAPAAVIGLGGIWLSLFLWRLRRIDHAALLESPRWHGAKP